MSEPLTRGGLLLALLATAAVAWWFQLRPELAFEGDRLERLPLALGAWRGEAIPLESAVEKMLRADLNLQRAYRSAEAGEVVWLYVGYYGTRRGGRPEHTPSVCYPSAGWEILDRQTWVGDAGRAERANVYVVARGGELRLVHFWYQSSRSTALLGAWDVSVDQLVSRLSEGRADGALVRISTPIVGDDVEAAHERLVAFRRVLIPELAARWPTERPAEQAPARRSGHVRERAEHGALALPLDLALAEDHRVDQLE